MIDNGINNSYYPKRFVGKVKPPKIRRRGNLVIIDKPKERDIDIYYTVNGNDPTITDTKLVGNVINVSSVDVLKVVSIQKRKFHTPVYSDICTINVNSSPIPTQEIYALLTVGGDANPEVSENTAATYFAVKYEPTTLTAKAGNVDMDVQLIGVITEEAVESVPEFATYIGWYAYVAGATNLEAGSYNVVITADDVVDYSLSFVIEEEVEGNAE